MDDPGAVDLSCDILVVGRGPAARLDARTVQLDEAAVWGAFAPDEVAAVVDGVSAVFRPRILVLAQRPFALPFPVPGWGLPGVGTVDAWPEGDGPLVLAGHAGAVVRAALAAAARGEAVAGVAATGIGLRDRVRLRRAGIRVLHGAVPLAAEGRGRFEQLVVAWRGRVVRLSGGRCVLHGGWAAETALARALGARHRVVGPGLLETVVDAAGRSSVPQVFVVAAPLQLPPQAVPERFADDDIVCPCEGVTAGQVRLARHHGAGSLPAVKRATRAGMGRCQARRCGPTLHAFCGGGTEAHGIAPRAPIRPVRIGALARDLPDPGQEPLSAPAVTRWITAPPAPVPPRCDVLVIGGGVMGLCAARALARAGRDVLVVDRSEPGLGASTANAGSLHIQLLGYDFEVDDPGPLGEALALGPRSIAMWREIAAEAGETLGLRTEGGLVLAADAADLAWLERKVAFERARGVETVLIGPADLRAMAPALAPGYAGAAFCAAEGQIDPLRGTMALLGLVRAAGARVLQGAEVQGMEPDRSGWRVATPGGVIGAHQVLNAAGAHAGVIGRLAGVALPVRAVVQQVIATAPAPPMLRQLVAQARTRLSLKQGDGGHVLIGGGWPGRLGADGATRLLRQSVQGNLATAIRAVPALAEIEAVRAWTGLTVHLDRSPVISATPGQPGLFHAVTQNGYTLGPVAGEMIAAAMLGREVLPGSFALG